MAKRTFTAGAASQTIDIFIRDSSSTTGAGLAGLVFNTANLKAYYRKGATGSATAITLATQTVGGAWSSGGFVEIDATNAKGLYRFDVPDTVLAASPWATLSFYGATNMAQLFAELEITAYNPFDAVRMGITALPNAAVSGVGGLLTAPTTANVGLADLSRILGTALTETAGQIAAAFKKWFDVATPSGTVNSIPNATAGAAGGLFIAGTNAATTITTGLTTHFIGTVDTVTTYTGNTVQTGDAYARLGAPAGASTAADIAAVKVDTAAVKAKTDNLPASPAAVGSAMTLTGAYDFAKGTVAMTESYAANTVAPTPAQALFAIQQHLMDFAISGTSYTVYKLDHATTAYIGTLDSAVTPTSQVRT